MDWSKSRALIGDEGCFWNFLKRFSGVSDQGSGPSFSRKESVSPAFRIFIKPNLRWSLKKRRPSAKCRMMRVWEFGREARKFSFGWPPAKRSEPTQMSWPVMRRWVSRSKFLK